MKQHRLYEIEQTSERVINTDERGVVEKTVGTKGATKAEKAGAGLNSALEPAS